MRSFPLFLAIILTLQAAAQENYEIQVYASPTQARGSTIFELHSNYFIDGNKQSVDGVIPTHHSVHETLEITHGISNNAELGFYIFTNITSPYGFQFVGIHLRPRVKAPDSWNIPFGLSLSTEIGYQKAQYSSDTWSLEIRPIVDKQWGKFYASLNPTLGISLKSDYNKSTPTFDPNAKLSFQFFRNATLGVEYYGGMGYINQFEKAPDQGHALYLVYDMINNAKWELNVGLGWGLTPATERMAFKTYMGRRITWGKKK